MLTCGRQFTIGSVTAQNASTNGGSELSVEGATAGEGDSEEDAVSKGLKSNSGWKEAVVTGADFRVAENQGSGVGAPAVLPADEAVLTILLMFALRAAVTWRTREPWWSVPLHPLTVLVALAIQWTALARSALGIKAGWKGRAYAAVKAEG